MYYSGSLTLPRVYLGCQKKIIIFLKTKSWGRHLGKKKDTAAKNSYVLDSFWRAQEESNPRPRA